MMITVLISTQFMGRCWYLQVPSSTTFPLFSLSSDNTLASCDCQLLLLSHFSRVQLCATRRRQPTRLPRPWDFPGKNTGVDCHFLLQCVKVKSESEVTQSCPNLSDPMDCSLPGYSIHGIFQARVLDWVAIAFSGDCQLG